MKGSDQGNRGGSICFTWHHVYSVACESVKSIALLTDRAGSSTSGSVSHFSPKISLLKLRGRPNNRPSSCRYGRHGRSWHGSDQYQSGEIEKWRGRTGVWRASGSVVQLYILWRASRLYISTAKVTLCAARWRARPLRREWRGGDHVPFLASSCSIGGSAQ